MIAVGEWQFFFGQCNSGWSTFAHESGKKSCICIPSPKHWAKMHAFLLSRPNIGRKRLLSCCLAQTLGENTCFLVISPKRWAKTHAFLLSRPNIGRKYMLSCYLAQTLGENACFLVISPKHWAKTPAPLSTRPKQVKNKEYPQIQICIHCIIYTPFKFC